MYPIGQIIFVELIEWAFPVGNPETIGVAVIFSNKEVILEGKGNEFRYFLIRLRVYRIQQEKGQSDT